MSSGQATPTSPIKKEKDSKGTRLAYVAPTIPRRLASTSDIEEKENRDSSSLRTSSSYTRRKWEDDLKKNSSINEGSTYHKRSYLTPVRDEESESQRKARSRQARQSRRSTQGVTLTDLQEAEKP